MTVVMLLVVRDDADVVDAQIAFHLSLGVDFVYATDHESTDGTADILQSYVHDGVLRRIPKTGLPQDAAWRAAMARLAVEERGATWIVDAGVDEFWMPRAEGIGELLAAMPERYGIVQGLVRVFPPSLADEGLFADRMTVRRPLSDLNADESMGRLDWALRPLHRAARTWSSPVTGRRCSTGAFPCERGIRSRCCASRFGAATKPSASGRDGRAYRSPLADRAGAHCEGRATGSRALGRSWHSMTARRNGDWLNGLLVEDERLRDVLRRILTAGSSMSGAARGASVPCWQARSAWSHPASSTMCATQASARPSARWTSSLSRTGSQSWSSASRHSRWARGCASGGVSLGSCAGERRRKRNLRAKPFREAGRRRACVVGARGSRARSIHGCDIPARRVGRRRVGARADVRTRAGTRALHIAWVSLARAAHRLARRACAKSAAAATAGSATSRAPTGCSARVHVAPERPVRARLASDGSLALRLEPAGCHQGREVRAAPHGIRCKAHSALHRELGGRERLPRTRAWRAA